MKRILKSLACLLLLTATVVKAETLTNDSVIQLHKLGLGDAVIVSKIQASTCNFDTSVDALKVLKDAGISDSVIQAMLLTFPSTKAAPAPATTAPAGDPNDPKAAHASGIYLYQTIDGKPKMTLLALSRIEDVTSGSGWGMAFGASSKTRAVIAGAHAELQIPDAEPVFYFYFPKTTDDGLGSADVSATSPDDYALGVLEAHTSHDKPVRRIEISKVSMGGYHMGLNPKDLRPFTSEKIADGAYKVTPNPLKSGEYVFVQLAGTRMMTTLKTYDFGIAAGK
jgi:hypothetical protein